MPSVTIRFYEELNDFLPPRRRKIPFSVEFAQGCTAKAIIEDLGVPHTEVDLIIANGNSVGFEYRLNDADQVSVYPMFESWDIGGLSRVRAVPLRETRFAVDVHLGKLARLLRMVGFDAQYSNTIGDEELARLARLEKRIILSRDRGLLKRRTVTHGYLVRSAAPRRQLAEVLRRFDLAGGLSMFTRCMECNLPLARVDKASIAALLPVVVASTYNDFSRCPGCGRVFWRGTHWERMKALAAEVLGAGLDSRE
ncbi:MAG: Mut7-C RNAse domain-containing protein [Spirochaetia bacterium]|jgi:uncharacterized protein with PIN domain